MASGLPVVVNDIETMEELVQNGKNGFRTDFDNHKHVSNLIIKLLKDRQLRKKIELFNRSHTKKFDWSFVAKKIDKVYQEAMNLN